ncbi:uncharacterized protein [Rutidosis leptorrhynchoides]|uniref:uncharacterized protein n=1 Tax=Rutidosis leptorrhynchoides TaxID=125765 RepID=UPI003A99529C
MFLIGKWWWRFKTETTSLWVKVISSIYGPLGGLLVDNPSHVETYKSVWNDIIKTGDNIIEIGIPFRNLFVKDIGNGGSTSFWNDSWIGNEVLKDKFKRLWRLETATNALVKDRVIWNGSNWVCNWHWAREPTRRARGELQSLSDVILGVVLNPDKTDTWKWTSASNGIFTTKALTIMLNSRILNSSDSNCETLHNKLVPKKVEVFVWRARKTRLPVLFELDKRGVDLNLVCCPLCDDDIESVNHSLIHCKHAFEVWSKVFDWWGRGGIPFINVGDLFIDSGQASSSMGKVNWQSVVWTCSYLIWKNRNQKVFTNKCWNAPVALNEIQVTSFEWIAKRCKEKFYLLKLVLSLANLHEEPLRKVNFILCSVRLLSYWFLMLLSDLQRWYDGSGGAKLTAVTGAKSGRLHSVTFSLICS